jgi:hypothetical protein
MRVMATALLAGAAMGAGAAQAVAQTGHAVTLSGPVATKVGQPAVYQATGTVASDAFLARYINAYAIPVSVTSECPGTYQGAIQVAYASAGLGGASVALAVPAEGSFSVPIVYTPEKAGRFLLCAYLNDAGETDAVASVAVDVSGAASVGDSVDQRPSSLSAPVLRRSGGRLICSRGTWSAGPTGFRYRWRADGRRIRDATGRTLRITSRLRGRVVRCTVTATNARGSTTRSSATLRA